MEIAFCRWVCVDVSQSSPLTSVPRTPIAAPLRAFIAEGGVRVSKPVAQRLDCPIARLGDAGSQ